MKIISGPTRRDRFTLTCPRFDGRSEARPVVVYRVLMRDYTSLNTQRPDRRDVS